MCVFFRTFQTYFCLKCYVFYECPFQFSEYFIPQHDNIKLRMHISREL